MDYRAGDGWEEGYTKYIRPVLLRYGAIKVTSPPGVWGRDEWAPGRPSWLPLTEYNLITETYPPKDAAELLQACFDNGGPTPEVEALLTVHALRTPR